eukprot:TRINITY_DN38663_c0_g1_i1.p1 TRINITY_DN38663_c0_g1~~TRINITY_DN38663_c0_g1_i1.p1  ORF type:complete len:140 (-),score=12.85 TRINITY_DN38663_c0_g1_i1:70-489(-)
MACAVLSCAGSRPSVRMAPWSHRRCVPQAWADPLASSGSEAGGQSEVFDWLPSQSWSTHFSPEETGHAPCLARWFISPVGSRFCQMSPVPSSGEVLSAGESTEQRVSRGLWAGRRLRGNTVSPPPRTCLLYTSPSPRDS